MMEGKSQQSDVGPQYLAAIIVNLLSFSYGVIIGWTAPMQPLLQGPQANETTFWDTSVMGISDESMSWIGGTFCIGGIAGTPIYGYLANAIGRKKSLIAAAVPFLLCFFLKIIATNTIYLYIARILAGIGGAGTLCIVPMYIGETVDDSIRGVLSACLNLFICTGILAGFIVGSYTSYLTLALFGSGCTIIFVVFVMWCPETPVYSLMNNRPDEAYSSLRKLKGKHPEVVEKHMNILSSSVKEMLSNNKSPSIKELFQDEATRKGLAIALIAMTIQQASGVAPILNYTVFIFAASGSQLSPSLAAIIVGALQLVGAIIGTMFMDKAGRRILLMISSIGMALTLAPIAYFFYLKTHGADDSTLMAIGWLPVTSLAIFIVSYGLGFGPVPYVLVSEIFKTEAKSVATSISIFHVWFMSFVFLKFFSNMSDAFGIDACFAIFAVCCGLGSLFTYFCVVETKGKSLEQIIRELGGSRSAPATYPSPNLDDLKTQSKANIFISS